MQTIKLLLFLVLICSACSNKDEAKADIKFERAKWDIKDDDIYLYRKQMVNDLLTNYKWAGIKKDSVIKLLGQPDEIEEDTFLIYNFNQSPFGFAPFSSKQFIIELAADSTVKLARK